MATASPHTNAPGSRLSGLGLFALVSAAMLAHLTYATWQIGIPIEHAIATPLSGLAAIGGDSGGLVLGGDSASDQPVVIIDGDPKSGPWQVATVPSPAPFSLWGHGVARSNGRIAVGAPGRVVNGETVGSVTLLERDPLGMWNESGEILGLAPGDLLGWSVALEGERLVVGAPTAVVDGLSGAGLVRVYSRVADAWTLTETLHSDQPSVGEFFGAALSLHGNVLAVGGTGSNRAGPSGAGAAWLFESDGRAPFTLTTVITSPTPQTGAALGASVDARAGILAAGAPGADGDAVNDGAVLVAARVRGRTWSLTTLSKPAGVAWTGFGTSVVVRDARIIASAAWTSQSGSCDFRFSNGAWGFAETCSLRGPLCQYGPRVAGGQYGTQLSIGIAAIDLDCGAPDVTNDCNNNFIPDECDIAGGDAPDLDGDGHIDTCPVARVGVEAPNHWQVGMVLTGHIASSGSRVAVTPMLKDFSDVFGGFPQFVDFSIATAGDMAQFVPLTGGYYPGGTQFAMQQDWLAMGGVSAGLGRVSFFEIGTDGALTPNTIVTSSVPQDYFGWTVASTSHLLFAASPNDPNGIYPIRRFERSASGAWSEIAPLALTEPGPATGVSLAIEGDRLAVSDQTPSDGTYATGRVRIFALRDDGGPVEEASIRAPIVPGIPGGSFGGFVRLSGERVIVASTIGSDQRVIRVSIFRRTAAAEWLREGELSIPSTYTYARSMAVDGNRIAIGRTTVGIPIFVRAANGSWVQTDEIDEGVYGWGFGSAVTFLANGSLASLAYNLNPQIHTTELWLLDPYTDCNSNSIDDSTEIAEGLADENLNGIPDACELAGDMNMDGVVNAVDLGIFLGRFNQGPGLGDLNDDGAVDAADLSILLAGWGN